MAEESYRAYVSNVKELEKHRTIIVLLANRAIKENKEAELSREIESWTLETKKEKILSSSKYKHQKSRYKSFKLDSLRLDD